MADNVLSGVKIEISGDWSRLEVDFKSAEKAAQSAGSKIASSMTVSMQSSAAATDQFSAAIDRLIATQSRENAALALSIQRNAAMQSTLRATSSGLQGVGKAATEAGGKVQSFVGLIPGLGRAAEQFINLIPGLGRGIMTIFPVLGFVALAESVGRIAGNVYDLAKAWDPVLSAEKRATDQAEKFSQEIATVRKHLQAMADAKFGDMFGQSAMQAAQAAQKGLELATLRNALMMAQQHAANPNSGTQGAVGTAVSLASVAIPGLKPLADRYAKGNRIDTATATQDVVLLQSKIREVEAEQAELSRKSIETHLNDQVDVRNKAMAEAEKAQKKENEGWENRYKLFEEALKQVQAARDKDLEDEKRYTDAMEEQKQRWVKINLDAKDERLKQAKIDVPVESRVAPNLEIGMALKKSGIGTTQVRESQIAEDQRLLNMAQAVNVPLGTQLKMREQILQEQIALGQEQGKNVDAELIGLRKLQDQQDKMRQSPKAILHSGLSSIAGTDQTLGTKMATTGIQLTAMTVDGLSSALARAAVEGGKVGHMLRDVGKQLAMTAATSVLKMGLQAALKGIMQLIPAFAGIAAAQTSAAATAHAATSAINVGSVMSYAAVGAAAAAASTAAIPIVGPLLAPEAAAATYAAISALAPLAAFADGGRPPVGVPSLVGERGPELFIPDQAGRIVPNHQLAGGAGLSLPSAAASGGGNISIGSITAHGVNNPREFVREVARQLPAYLKSTNPKYSPAAR